MGGKLKGGKPFSDLISDREARAQNRLKTRRPSGPAHNFQGTLETLQGIPFINGGFATPDSGLAHNTFQDVLPGEEPVVEPVGDLQVDIESDTALIDRSRSVPLSPVPFSLEDAQVACGREEDEVCFALPLVF